MSEVVYGMVSAIKYRYRYPYATQRRKSHGVDLKILKGSDSEV